MHLVSRPHEHHVCRRLVAQSRDDGSQAWLALRLSSMVLRCCLHGRRVCYRLCCVTRAPLHCVHLHRLLCRLL